MISRFTPRLACQALVLLLLSCGLVSTPARADKVYAFVIEKQEKKAPQRWSLSEWLETRDRMQLMDLWLALHSPSPYEFFLEPSLSLPESGGASSFTGKAGAYASVVGFEVSRSFGAAPEWKGALSLRVMGYHIQGTHLSVHAGLRSRELSVTQRNGYAGGELTAYLMKYAGIEGRAHYHFPAVGSAGSSGQGIATAAAAFLEFSFLRLSLARTSDPIDGSSRSAGYEVGARFFF